jgi:hypothetical protein
MIKLKSLLYETTALTDAGDSAGQLWPFAQRASYAKRWESARMEDLFGGSLEGMERVDDNEMAYIASIHDIDDLDDLQLAGKSGSHWHTDLPESVLGDWELVRHMFDMGEVDRVAADKPGEANDLITKTSELKHEKD